MKRDENIKALRSLAQSRGFFGRILEAIDSLDEDEREEYFTVLEEQSFSGPVDLALFIEG